MKSRNILAILMTATLLGGGIFTHPRAMAALAQQQAQQQSPWKDRAEYDAFNAILQAQDPNQKIQLADKYLADYPESKFQDKTYELQLQAYQQLNNTQKMEETAKKLLEISSNNFRALFLLSYLLPRTIQPQDPAMERKLTEATDFSRRGLEQLEQLEVPEGMVPDAFEKQKVQSAAVFHQTAGFVALQRKNYPQAQQELRQSAEMNPSDALGFYWLGLSYLSPKPPEYDLGIWALARAVSITGASALPAPTLAEVKDYLGKVYESRHGSTEGLNQVMAQATASPFPSAGFHIASVEELQPEPEPEPEPEPVRELTVKPEELATFDVIVKYLQAGGVKEEDTWTLLHGASLTLPGKVVSATPSSRPTPIRLAVSPELAREEGKHDVEVTLAEALSKSLADGDMIQFDGVVDSYQPKPFVLRFKDGKIHP